jgi:hypothetical protein
MSKYNFDLSAVNHDYTVRVDTKSMYGCFEFIGDDEDQYCKGSLWFEKDGNGGLAVCDYDGVYELSPYVIDTLNRMGINTEYITGELGGQHDD